MRCIRTPVGARWTAGPPTTTSTYGQSKWRNPCIVRAATPATSAGPPRPTASAATHNRWTCVNGPLWAT